MAVVDGLTLDSGHVRVGGIFGIGQVHGSGEIVVDGGRIDANAGSELAAGVVVRTGAAGGKVRGGAAGTVLNRGIISAETAGETLSVSAKVTNLGTLRAINAGRLEAHASGNAGSIIVDEDSYLGLYGTYTLDQGVAVDNGATLFLDGA